MDYGMKTASVILAIVVASVGCGDQSEPPTDADQLRVERDQYRAEKDALTRLLAEKQNQIEAQRAAFNDDQDKRWNKLAELYNAMNERVTALEKPPEPKPSE